MRRAGGPDDSAARGRREVRVCAQPEPALDGRPPHERAAQRLKLLLAAALPALAHARLLALSRVAHELRGRTTLTQTAQKVTQLLDTDEPPVVDPRGHSRTSEPLPRYPIAQPMRAIGEGTVRLLLQILNGNGHAPESVTLPHTLTIRSSTAPPRAID